MSVASSDNDNDNSLHDGEAEIDLDEEEQLEDENVIELSNEELEEAADVGMEMELSIVAVPPKVVSYEENHLEVSSSPAFHILDAVSIFLLLFRGFQLAADACCIPRLNRPTYSCCDWLLAQLAVVALCWWHNTNTVY